MSPKMRVALVRCMKDGQLRLEEQATPRMVGDLVSSVYARLVTDLLAEHGEHLRDHPGVDGARRKGVTKGHINYIPAQKGRIGAVAIFQIPKPIKE